MNVYVGFSIFRHKITPNKIPVIFVALYHCLAVSMVIDLVTIVFAGLLIMSHFISKISFIIYPAAVMHKTALSNNVKSKVERVVFKYNDLKKSNLKISTKILLPVKEEYPDIYRQGEVV